MYPVQVSSAKYNRNNTIDCHVIWNTYPDEKHPYTASPNDVVIHGKQLYADLVAGKYGEITAYSAEDKKHDQQLDNENMRRRLLNVVEQTIMPLRDEALVGLISEQNQERLTAWIIYRKALQALDISSESIEWPPQPK